MANIEIVNESGYTFGSADNLRHYEFELDLSGGYAPNSVHGITVDDSPIAVFSAGGGTTGVHTRSFLEVDDRAYLAVGNSIICLSPAPFQYHWALEVDAASCFGVHYHPPTNALLSHGELDITRFAPSGEIIWSVSGADIFTGHVELQADFIEVRDFNGAAYRFDYADGHAR